MLYILTSHVSSTPFCSQFQVLSESDSLCNIRRAILFISVLGITLKSLEMIVKSRMLHKVFTIMDNTNYWTDIVVSSVSGLCSSAVLRTDTGKKIPAHCKNFVFLYTKVCLAVRFPLNKDVFMKQRMSYYHLFIQ